MSGRRSYARFNITPPPEGVLRVVRDVTMQREDGEEFLVLGRAAGVVGEVLTVEVAEGEAARGARAEVLESVPVIVDGSVRHQIRLRRVAGGRNTPPDDTGQGPAGPR
jgi:hypothetical protein